MTRVLVPFIALGALLGIDGGALSGAPAARGNRYCEVPASVPASAQQLVIVDALGGSFAGVSLRVRSAGQWQCTRDAMPARIGRNGILPLDRRVADDGTTPAGTFPLGTMTAPNGDVFQFFGNGADPGVHGGWHQVQGGDCWDATGGDAAYNTLVSRPAPQCTGDDEYLANSPGAYSRAALIGANMGPDRSGDGPGEVPRAAAIFLHRFSYDVGGATKATSGCVSLGDADLDAVLRVLVPGQAWFVVQGAG